MSMFSDKRGYCILSKRPTIYAHRAQMEKLLGRPLREDEVVHHIDGRRWNNCPFNLELVSRSDHTILHASTRTPRGWACKEHPRTYENTIFRSGGKTTCRTCDNRRRAAWKRAKRLRDIATASLS